MTTKNIARYNFFWEALLVRDFPVEFDEERHGYHNSYVTSLRCLLATVFMEMYCPSSSLLRWNSFFFILPQFMEKVLCHGSWQTTGCLLMPRRQDHGPPFRSSARLCTVGRGEAALPSLSPPQTGGCCWRTMDSQKQQGFSSQEMLAKKKTSASSTFSMENFNFSQAKAWRLSSEKTEASTISSPLSTVMEERITWIQSKHYRQQIKPHSGSIKGKRKAG